MSLIRGDSGDYDDEDHDGQVEGLQEMYGVSCDHVLCNVEVAAGVTCGN